MVPVDLNDGEALFHLGNHPHFIVLPFYVRCGGEGLGFPCNSFTNGFQNRLARRFWKTVFCQFSNSAFIGFVEWPVWNDV